MTTVACDGRTIAADGLITGNGVIHDTAAKKVVRLDSGAVAGFTGSVFLYSDAIDYLNGRRDSLTLGEDFEAIILHLDGTSEYMDGNGRRYRQPSPCATGSGTPMALAAMLAGMSAEQAVEIASRLDISTGGTITSMCPQSGLRNVA